MALGNTFVRFRWDGVDYELPYASVSSYDQRPIYAEDGYTLNRYETTMSGSCVIHDGANTFTDLATKFKNGTGQVERVLVSVTAAGGTENLIDVTFPDTMRGPLLHLTVTEINGRNACVVNWTVNAATAYPTQSGAPENEYPIISNRWTQRFSIDPSGHVTRTTSGVLVVNLAALGATLTPANNGGFAEVDGKAPWADLFRRAIAPAMTSTLIWRRESQTYAYNEAGNALIYEVVDSQARVSLPDGAYAGTAEFTYERSRQNLAFGVMRFSCDLEGAVTGDTRALVNAAVLISRSRIDYTKAFIQRISVNERDLLKKSSIRFEIDAWAPATGGLSDVGTVASVPLAAMVGRFFTVSRTVDWRPDPYGSGGQGVLGIPHWYGNSLQAKPESIPGLSVMVADVIDVLATPPADVVPTVTFVGPDQSFAAANAVIDVGPFNPAQATYSGDSVVQAVERTVGVTNATLDTGMHHMPTLYTQGADFVFQAKKAQAELTETVTVRRVNVPPPREYRPMPAGFYLVKDEWKVDHGTTDASGNRTFTGVYVRTIRAYDGGGATSNGYSTSGTTRRWWPTTNGVVAALTQGYSSTDQVSGSSVIDVSTSNPQTYALGTNPSYT